MAETIQKRYLTVTAAKSEVDDRILDAIELADAAFSDWQTVNLEEGGEDILATVPMRPLVLLATLALPTIEKMAPERYKELLEKHKLTLQDA